MQTTSAIFDKDTVTSTISILTFVGIILKFLVGYLKKPLDKDNETYKNADIKPWAIRLFSIKITLKSTPKISKIEYAIFSMVLVFCIAGTSLTTYFNIKILQVPHDWTALTLKSTKESFLMTDGKASEHAFKPTWILNNELCSTTQSLNLVDNNKISLPLKNYICNEITTNENHEALNKSIKEFSRSKPFLLIMLSALTILMSWFFVSIVLTIIYTKRLAESIKKDHKKASSYIE